MRAGKGKQHAGVLGEIRSEHHAGLLLVGSQRQFCNHFFGAKPKFHRLQFRQGLSGLTRVAGSAEGRSSRLLAAGQGDDREKQRKTAQSIHRSRLRKGRGIFNSHSS